MRFPFVLRSQHDEFVVHLRQQLADRDRELERLYDLIFKHQFGEQVFDTLAAPAEAVAEGLPVITTSAEETEIEPPEDIEERQRAEDIRRLQSIARTRPSTLGSAMAQMKSRDLIRKARAANPKAVPHPAIQVFEQIKQEAAG
jgi:hypothetical protein